MKRQATSLVMNKYNKAGFASLLCVQEDKLCQ